MSFTKTNLEILDIDKLVDFQTNYTKLEKSLLNNKTKDKDKKKSLF